MVIKRIDVLSVAKITGIIAAAFGLFFGVIFFLFSSLFSSLFGAILCNHGGGTAMFGGIAGIFLLPILYGIFGFIGGLIQAFVYNLASGFVGGVRIEVE